MGRWHNDRACFECVDCSVGAHVGFKINSVDSFPFNVKCSGILTNFAAALIRLGGRHDL